MMWVWSIPAAVVVELCLRWILPYKTLPEFGDPEWNPHDLRRFLTHNDQMRRYRTAVRFTLAGLALLVALFLGVLR